MILAVAVLATACSSGSVEPTLSSTLIAAFNNLYRGQTPVTEISPFRTDVAPRISEEAAIVTARRSCYNGADPTVVGVGLVRVSDPGVTPRMNDALWAIFVNPPGPHRVPNGIGIFHTDNWFVVLIDADAQEQHPWSCAAGDYSHLPALSIHN